MPLLPILLVIASVTAGSQSGNGAWLTMVTLFCAAPIGILFRDMLRTRSTSVARWFALVGCALLLGLAFGIVTEVSLSFLGLGVQPPTPSLGVLFSNARQFFMQSAYLITIPSTLITALMLCLVIIATRLRDTLPF